MDRRDHQSFYRHRVQVSARSLRQADSRRGKLHHLPTLCPKLRCSVKLIPHSTTLKPSPGFHLSDQPLNLRDDRLQDHWQSVAGELNSRFFMVDPKNFPTQYTETHISQKDRNLKAKYTAETQRRKKVRAKMNQCSSPSTSMLDSQAV